MVEGGDTVLKFHGVAPTQGVKFAHIGEFAQGAVGLGAVPLDGATVGHGGLDKFGELADGDLLAAADVDVAVAHLVARAPHILEVDMLQAIDAGVGHVLAPQEFTDGRTRAPQAQSVLKDAVFLQQGDDGFIGGAAVNPFHRAAVQVGTDAVDVALVEHLGQMHLPNHRRHDMAGLEVEVVARPVQVGGHHGDVVGAVLQIERLAHLQARDFGNSIGLVGVLQRSGEQCGLGDGLRGLSWIDAGAAQEEQFLHAVSPTLADDILLDGEILVDEVGAVLQVGHDAAHMGSRQHDILGLLLVKEAVHCHGIHQVQFLVGAADEVGVALGLQAVPDGTAHKAAVACHIYLSVFLHRLFQMIDFLDVLHVIFHHDAHQVLE